MIHTYIEAMLLWNKISTESRIRKMKIPRFEPKPAQSPSLNTSADFIEDIECEPVEPKRIENQIKTQP